MADMPNLIVVDDDADIRLLLADYLRKHGFAVTPAENGTELFAALADTVPDLIVLDVMLPGEDGLSLCRRLRERWAVPVIFLTALDSVTDRVVGLELGADDYMVKPFEPRELLARIRTVLRRTGTEPDPLSPEPLSPEPLSAEPLRTASSVAQSPEPPPLQEIAHAPHTLLHFDGWKLDVRSRDLHDPDGVLVNLSDAQYRLLMAFLEQPFQILSRDALLTRLHGREAEPFDRSIDIQVSRLRTRLRDNADARLIRTVRGGGYMFSATVHKESA